MYNKFVAKDKDVFATPLFLLSIIIPLVLAVSVGAGLYYSESFSSFLSNVWLTMKLPLAIASLSIPLATWVIANHRSAQITKSNKLQASKRLVETYLEQESFFERVYGRKITTAKWSFITKEDLPVIHAELYEFQQLQEKGEIKIRESVTNDVAEYFNATHRIFWEYYEHFVKEKESDNNEFLLESFTTQLYTYLHYNLASFSRVFGTQSVDMDDTCLSTYISAYFEIYQLCIDLKINTGEVNDETIREDYETFNAAATLISDQYGLRLENATLGRLKEAIGIKRIVKFATAEPHTQTINRLINSWAEKFVDDFSNLKMLAIEGKYLSFKLFTKDHNEFILMNFVETNEQEYFGEIQVTYDSEKSYMPIYKTETGITVNRDASSAEKQLADIIRLITKFSSDSM